MAGYPAKAHIVLDNSRGLTKGITTIADSIALATFVSNMTNGDYDILELKVTKSTGPVDDRARPSSVQAPVVSAIIQFGQH